MSNKSCFNCKHLKTWCHPATYWEPEDSGWECGHSQPVPIAGISQDQFDDIYDAVCDFDDEKAAAAIGEKCASFEYFDWGSYKAAQAEAEDRAMAEAELQAEKWRDEGIYPTPMRDELDELRWEEYVGSLIDGY